MKHIFLIGMPGSGKSTSGKRFAKAFGWGFVDLDKLIQIRTGKTIAAIFSQQGEVVFREYEQRALRETLASQKLVVACGGGTAAWFDNLAWMKEHGLVIWLDIPTHELKRRILEGKGNRPMFQGLNEREADEKLGILMEQRRSFFELAHYRVQSERELIELAPVLRDRFQKSE